MPLGHRQVLIDLYVNVGKILQTRLPHPESLHVPYFSYRFRRPSDLLDEFLVGLHVHQFAGALPKEPGSRPNNDGNDH